MQTNVLEYLEQTLPRVPDKVAFADDQMQLTFAQVSRNARAVGSALSFFSIPEPGRLYSLIQRHRTFMPAFGTFLL